MTIGNRFFVTALEDGSTLHGNLVSDKSLTQAWNGSSAIPDWYNTSDTSAGTSDSPTITLTLLAGNIQATAANIVAQKESGVDIPMWYYNGGAITFSGVSSIDTTGTFVKGTDGTTGMPTLKIVKNLASSSNKDMDTIVFKGAYSMGNASIPFEASIQIRISEITANGYLGIVDFQNGISNFTEANQNILMEAHLYGGAVGREITPATNYSVNWYINGTLFNTTDFPNSRTYTASANTFYRLELNSEDVVDNATIRCEFIYNGSTEYNAYVAVDDMQDPQYMYIQFNGANGNAASLRNGESVEFLIWVGQTNDPTVDASWNNFKLLLLNSDGEVIMDTSLAVNIPDPDSGGWRTLPKYSGVSVDAGKAYVTIGYATAFGAGKKNLTGIILAEQTSS